MSALAPPLLTVTQFQNLTGGVGMFKPGRGLLAMVDQELTSWNGGHCIGHRKQNLVRILSACRTWIEQKQGKGSTLANSRRAAVEQLATQAFARLQYEKFETHKRQHPPGHALPGRVLQGGYAHERTTYVNSHKTQALSGSTASALIKNAASIGLNNPPNFNAMTDVEFRQLVETYAPNMLMETEVKFFTKAERLGNMIIVRNGSLMMGADKPFDTGGREWAWAMDTYGNLFSTNQNVQSTLLPGHQRFNHSTLNAGKDVACAGILQAAGGKLTYLDNASGHYRPRRLEIAQALNFLNQDGYNFDSTVCGVRIMEQVGPNMQWSCYTNARTLLINPNAMPDAIA